MFEFNDGSPESLDPGGPEKPEAEVCAELGTEEMATSISEDAVAESQLVDDGDTEPTAPETADEPDANCDGPDVTATDNASIMAAVVDCHDDLASLFSKLAEQFDQHILRSDQERKTIDLLHSQLQDYQRDIYAQLVRPVLADIAATREHLLKIVCDQRDKPADAQSIPLDTLASFADDLADILESNDVEIYHASAGDNFDPQRQRAVATEQCDSGVDHKTIAKPIGDGYLFRSRVLSPQRAIVRVYTTPVTEQPPTFNSQQEGSQNG